MESRLKVVEGRVGFIVLLYFGFGLSMKEKNIFNDNSLHEIRIRKHTYMISETSCFNTIDDIVLCVIKQKQH